MALDSVLSHHGIKGMKWGIRKNKPKVDVSSEDSKRAQAAAAIVKKHGTKALNNKDLQDLVNRMNLEQQYNKLILNNPGTVKKGHAAVKDILGMAKTAQDVYTLANGPAAKALAKAMTKSKS